jgi:hypothetical protein
MTIILRKFNFDYITDSSLILVIGAPSSGKSSAIKNLLYHKNIPSGLIISHKPQHKINKTYDYIPPIFIHNRYDDNIVKRYIHTQKKNIELDNMDFDTRTFIILENVLYQDDEKSKYMSVLFKKYSILNMLTVLEMEYIPHEITKPIKRMKQNVDYIFIFKDYIQLNRQKLFNLFKDEFGIEYSLFNKFMDDYTNNYNFLILDVKSQSKNIQDKLYWYKAGVYPNLRLCNDEAWIYNNNNYVEESKETNENYLQKIYSRQIY